MVELRSPTGYSDITREESGIEGFAAAFAKYGVDDVAEMVSFATAIRKVNHPASESEGFEFSGAVADGLVNLETPVFAICGEMAANATFALKAGEWVRRDRLVIVRPPARHRRRFQAVNPLNRLSEFPRPALKRKA